jgi:hypothetical protein
MLAFARNLGATDAEFRIDQIIVLRERRGIRASPFRTYSPFELRRRIMPFDLKVRINKGAGAAQFVPQGSDVAVKLRARRGDRVFWGNYTQESHLPWPTDGQGHLLPNPFAPQLSEAIPPAATSVALVLNPVQQGTVTIMYRCAIHPDRIEFGEIEVS